MSQNIHPSNEYILGHSQVAHLSLSRHHVSIAEAKRKESQEGQEDERDNKGHNV